MITKLTRGVQINLSNREAWILYTALDSDTTPLSSRVQLRLLSRMRAGLERCLVNETREDG